MFGSHGRVLQLRSAALGALRRDLIVALGTERAKGFLLRYGWSLGQADAINLRRDNPQFSDQEWMEAGPRLHGEAGMVRVRVEVLHIDRGRGEFRLEGRWEDSYEAQEHLRHFGLAREPACWTLVGYAGGYSTEVFGERIIYKEVSCVARGDEVCRFVGLPEREWGLRIARDIPLYEEEVLGEELDVAHRRIRLQNAQLQQVLQVHDELTRVLLRGMGLEAIAASIGRLLGSAVSVEDRQFRPLAAFVPRQRPQTEREPVTLGAILQGNSRLEREVSLLQKEKRAIFLSLGSTGPGGPDRVVAPILLGDELLGFVTMAVAEGLTPVLTRMVAERTALACGLELIKERTAVEVEQRLRGDFLENLLAPDSDAAFLNKWARYLGLSLEEVPHRFYLVQPERRPEGEDNQWTLEPQDRLQGTIQQVVDQGGQGGFVVLRGGGVAVLLPNAAGDPAALGERMREAALAHGHRVWVGISRPFQGACEARTAYEECRTILSTVREEGLAGPILQVDRLGALQIFFRCEVRSELSRFAQDLLGPLLDYDQAHQSELVSTLRLYLDTEGNLQQTARLLNISISGLKYRLQRIQELGRFDLSDPERRFDLLVALRLLALERHRY